MATDPQLQGLFHHGSQVPFRLLADDIMGRNSETPLSIGKPSTLLAQRDVTLPAPAFKYQHRNGTVDLDISCSIQEFNGVRELEPEKGLLWKLGLETKFEACVFEVALPVGGATTKRQKLAQSITSSSRRCDAVLSVEGPTMQAGKGRLGTNVEGRVWVASDGGPIHFSIPRVWAEEGLEMHCKRNYSACDRVHLWFRRLEGCELGRTTEERNTSIKTSSINAVYRVAEIRLPSPSRQEELGKGFLSVGLGTRLTLRCKVRNQARFDNHTCQWTFSASQQSSSALTINNETLMTDPTVSSRFGGGRLSLLSGNTSDGHCELDIPRALLADQGYWSCAPGKGTRGWIQPSPQVEVKLKDACSDDQECKRKSSETVCRVSESLHEAAIPLKSCIHPCDTPEGVKVCGNVKNAVCAYDPQSLGSVRCICNSTLVSNTGFSHNWTRCVKQCNRPSDCLDHETCAHRPTPGSNGRCLPICEAHPCGANAYCLPHDRTGNLGMNRTCSCKDRTYPIDSSVGAGSGCKIPTFGGLEMVFGEDGGSRQECAVTKINGVTNCAFSISEKSKISFVCRAIQTFPRPQLKLTMEHGQYGPVTLRYDWITFESESRKLHEDSVVGQHETSSTWDPAVKASLVNTAYDNHNGSTITCRLSSKTQTAEVRVTLAVIISGNNFSKETFVWLGSVAGVTALLLMLIALVAVLTKVYSRRRQGRRKSATEDFDVAMHSIQAAEDGETRPADANATGMTFAESSNEFLSNDGEDNDEPIYEDVEDDGLATNKNAQRWGNNLIGTTTRTETRHHGGLHQENTATAIALGDGKLSPNILPAKKHALGADFTHGRNLQPGMRVHRQEHISAGISSQFIPLPTCSHAETHQNHLRRPSATETNAPSAPMVEAEYDIVVA